MFGRFLVVLLVHRMGWLFSKDISQTCNSHVL